MEFVGFTISVASLISVYGDVLERVGSFKEFGIHSRTTATRFEAEKIRLRSWADAVGIADGKLRDSHHPRLDHPQIVAGVEMVLTSICEIFQTTERTKTQLRLSSGGVDGTSLDLPSSSQSQTKDRKVMRLPTSKRSKFAWACGRKEKFTGQVEIFEVLVAKLHALVPPNEDTKRIIATDKQGNYVEDDLTRSKNTLASFQNDIQALIEGTRRSTVIQMLKEIDGWLDVTKMDQQYEKYVSLRLEGTCDWILDNFAYKAWASTDFPDKATKFLWICGPAGFGKTILCARLIQHLKEVSTRPTVYLFSHNHVQAGGQPDGIVRSWISQIIRLNQDAFELAKETLQEDEIGQMASQNKTWVLFRSIVSQVPNCTFVVDGLDEYSQGDDFRIHFLQELKMAVAGTEARVLIISRDEVDIKSQICSAAENRPEYVMLECRISKSDTQSDITLYSKSIVDEKLSKKPQSIREEFALDMAKRCEGMFLWIKLQQGQLQGWRSRRQLQDIVNGMPRGLDSTYERDLKRIQSLEYDDQNRAIAILRWATFALRPMTVYEITEALVIDPNDENENLQIDELPDSIDDEYIDSAIKGFCGSLIDIRAADPEKPPGFQTVHLVHASVKEYLLSKPPNSQVQKTFPIPFLDPDAANGELSKVCLRYLNHKEIWKNPSFDENTSYFSAFRDYAARSWHLHINGTITTDHKLTNLLNELFHPDNPNFDAWKAYFESVEEARLEDTEWERKPSTSLYYAALLGFLPTLKFLLTKGQADLNSIGGKYGTALQAACAQGHADIFAYLINEGADINLDGGEFGSALNAAAATGQQNMVQCLINLGANLALVDPMGRMSLYLAAMNGHYTTVVFLLEAGSNINTQNKFGWTTLNSAAESGHLEIVKLLLDRGADPNITTNYEWTPLSSATESGHLEIVKLLLDRGADPNITINYGWPPLYFATKSGHLEIIKLLLDRGADPNITTNYGWTPLYFATESGHLEIVKLLLDRGADPNITVNYGWPSLYLAVERGYLEIIKLLLDRGANINDKSGWYGTVLKAALAQGNEDIEEFYSNVLNSAASNGDVKLLQLVLQQNGLNSNSTDSQGRSPLHIAARYNQIEGFNYLLDQGFDIAAKDIKGDSVLHYAACGGSIEAVNRILQLMNSNDANS
ncbi:MAG: hypothetical protein M1834_005975 [Cirrosporium novae-zelandiae]|nr:MAG: hypothetical protein M1834_005975 [Cirrosporium novae-zelandiae]